MTIKDSNKSKWFNVPEGIVALFCIQIFSTLSFSVLYSTLVLYMTGTLGLPAKLANNITGIFVAFNFALHLLGGYWGGRFFSYRALFSLGMVAQIIGCVFLATVDKAYLYIGLAAFLTGCGLNVTCINCMLTQRFKPNDNRRETAFLFNYAGMNIGFFVGFSLSGYFQLSHNYQRLFLLSSLGNLLALLICLYYWHALGDNDSAYSRLGRKSQRRASGFGLMMVCLLPLVLSQLLHFADLAGKLVLFTGMVILVVAYMLAIRQNTREARDKIFAFIVLMVVSTVFWMLFQIGPMGLTHFIENNVQRHWLLMTIPPQWFQNINTISIVIGGPLLSIVLNRLRTKGVNVNIPCQFALALVLIGLAFAFLPVGITRADHLGLVSPGWVVLSFVLQSIGELLISPIGYAMIGALAPSSLQGVMMGMWMLTTGVGATLSSYSSNLMTANQNSVDPLITNAGYSQVFLCLGLISIAVGIMLYLLVPVLKRWIGDRPDAAVEHGNLVTV
ncbi:peptide MFS transporter [Legionella spiritensis]|uniref:peptide MFS transporter n=1 Tax=Legionella spiritensis TaxID=452 RepID=UPI000F6E43AD|nr:oligopeptide:H+ symporter [Legionella spiritensis]VEG90193.1 peptide transport protein, POT family [Legionella spiritensis]